MRRVFLVGFSALAVTACGSARRDGSVTPTSSVETGAFTLVPSASAAPSASVAAAPDFSAPEPSRRLCVESAAARAANSPTSASGAPAYPTLSVEVFEEAKHLRRQKFLGPYSDRAGLPLAFAQSYERLYEQARGAAHASRYIELAYRGYASSFYRGVLRPGERELAACSALHFAGLYCGAEPASAGCAKARLLRGILFEELGAPELAAPEYEAGLERADTRRVALGCQLGLAEVALALAQSGRASWHAAAVAYHRLGELVAGTAKTDERWHASPELREHDGWLACYAWLREAWCLSLDARQGAALSLLQSSEACFGFGAEQFRQAGGEATLAIQKTR